MRTPDDDTAERADRDDTPTDPEARKRWLLKQHSRRSGAAHVPAYADRAAATDYLRSHDDDQAEEERDR